MRAFYIYIVFILFFSCQRKKNYNSLKNEKTTTEIKRNTDTLSNSNSKITEVNFWNYEINTQKIKSQLDYVTTGFLTQSESKIFPDRIKNNFYGFYNLIQNDKKGVPKKRIGKMIVYDSINPYKYDKDTDEFVEIILKDKGISLFNGKLKIGMSYFDIIKSFGKAEELKFDNSNILLYRNENKIALLMIKNNILSKIRIGFYKEGLNTDVLIKDFGNVPN